MSVLVKYMKMPEGCHDCPISNGAICQLMPEAGYDDGGGCDERRSGCPLVEMFDNPIVCDGKVSAYATREYAESLVEEIVHKVVFGEDGQ